MATQQASGFITEDQKPQSITQKAADSGLGKLCIKCHTYKSIEEFHVKKRDQYKTTLESSCKLCQRPKRKQTKKAWEKTDKGRFGHLKNNAKRRNITLELTLEEFLFIIKNGKCQYCEGDIGEIGSRIDRIDSKLGYTKDNCVPCCKECNWMKSNIWSYSEFLEIGKIVKLLKDRRTGSGNNGD